MGLPCRTAEWHGQGWLTGVNVVIYHTWRLGGGLGSEHMVAHRLRRMGVAGSCGLDGLLTKQKPVNADPLKLLPKQTMDHAHKTMQSMMIDWSSLLFHSMSM